MFIKTRIFVDKLNWTELNSIELNFSTGKTQLFWVGIKYNAWCQKQKIENTKGSWKFQVRHFANGKCQLTTEVPMLAWHSSQCAARHACPTCCIHSSGYFVRSLHQTQALRATTPLKLHYSSWKHHVEGRGAVSTNGWPTSPSQQSPGHCGTKIRKIPGTKTTQKITGYEFYEGGDPKKNLVPRRQLLASWYVSKTFLSMSRLPHLNRAFPRVHVQKKRTILPCNNQAMVGWSLILVVFAGGLPSYETISRCYFTCVSFLRKNKHRSAMNADRHAQADQKSKSRISKPIF